MKRVERVHLCQFYGSRFGTLRGKQRGSRTEMLLVCPGIQPGDV